MALSISKRLLHLGSKTVICFTKFPQIGSSNSSYTLPQISHVANPSGNRLNFYLLGFSNLNSFSSLGVLKFPRLGSSNSSYTLRQISQVRGLEAKGVPTDSKQELQTAEITQELKLSKFKSEVQSDIKNIRSQLISEELKLSKFKSEVQSDIKNIRSQLINIRSELMYLMYETKVTACQLREIHALTAQLKGLYFEAEAIKYIGVVCVLAVGIAVIQFLEIHALRAQLGRAQLEELGGAQLEVSKHEVSKEIEYIDSKHEVSKHEVSKEIEFIDIILCIFALGFAISLLLA